MTSPSPEAVQQVAFTPGPWSVTAGNLIRVMAKGTGICIAGVHRIGKARDCPEADAQAIANARLIAAETRAEGIRRHLPAALASMRERYPAAPDFRVREHAVALAELEWAAERSRATLDGIEISKREAAAHRALGRKAA